MIKNERQYAVTRNEVRKFESALERFNATRTARKDDPRLLQGEHDSIVSMLAELKEQVGEYEALRSGHDQSIEVGSLSELPEGLIKARIAAGLTQRELADRVGLKEQQVQRYEASDYASASVSRVMEIARALNLVWVQPMKAVLGEARETYTTEKRDTGK